LKLSDFRVFFTPFPAPSFLTRVLFTAVKLLENLFDKAVAELTSFPGVEPRIIFVP
jgi:hypothetical protein